MNTSAGSSVKLQDHERASQPGMRAGGQRHQPQHHVRLLGHQQQVV
jgi:hypothetical protein